MHQLFRLPYTKGLWARFPVGPVELKVEYGIYERPHCAYGVYWSAFLASQLRIPRITVIEFGVAGGRGLLALERLAREIGDDLGVRVDVVGFDSGTGMPPAQDYRDLPHVWSEGFYGMDEAKLRARLCEAKLVLGNVAETLPQWLENGIEGPVGFVVFDLDYYSSTVHALKLFDAPASTHLPRVHCYFDDLAGHDLACMNRYVGEHLAIAEFNAAHASRKVCPIEHLRLSRNHWESWQDRMYAFHDFAHADYARRVIPLESRHIERPL